MKIKILILVAFIFFAVNSKASQRVRRVPVKDDQIVTVRTSIGIATIIQVPDRPNSVVVGDHDSFKVEYLEQAITIKPLSGVVKSNLYIYTDWKRFNVELVSGSEEVADYVVYLENPKEKLSSKSQVNPGIQWTNYANSLRNNHLQLVVKRLGRTKDRIFLIEFMVNTKNKEDFKPGWIWLTQRGEVKPIHNLFMSSLEVTPQISIEGVLQVREDDLNIEEPFRIEMRRQKTSYLTIKKNSSWKR